MGKGIWYKERLGKPHSLLNLTSEWSKWAITGKHYPLFLKEIDEYMVKKGSVALWALGGAGFILKSQQSIIYIDPYCGGSIPPKKIGDKTIPPLYRMIPLPFNPSDVKNIDATAITHEDLDHLNEDYIFPVNQNTNCLFIGPPSTAELLESWKISKDRIISLGEYENKKIKDVNVIGLPSNDPIPKTANTYIFEIGNIRIFHSGDSLFFEEYAEIGAKYDIDIALINLGLNPPGMKLYNNPGEVVQIARDLGTKIVIPMHWDIWSEFLDNPYLVEQEVNVRRMDIKVKILRIGERFDYP